VKRFIDITAIMSRESAGWMVFGLLVLIMAEVFTRYILRTSLLAADEIGAYMVVGITFLGLAHTWVEKSHIRIEFVIRRVPARARQWLRIITLFMAAAITMLLIWAGYEFVSYSHKIGKKSATVLEIPLQYPEMVIGVGALLVFIVIVAELVTTVKATKNPER